MRTQSVATEVVIRVSPRVRTQSVATEMNKEVIERSRLVKCLGALVDDGLNWKEHVQSVRRKCFAGLAKLRRLRDVLPPKTKKQIYNGLVQPHLDYCSVVWQECSRELRRSLERVQNYGMRLILSKPPRTPSEQLREELGWKTLEERRSRSRLYLVHKCITGQAPASLCQRVELNTRNTRGGLKLVLPRPTTDFFKKSFCFRGAQDWNTLPSDIRTINTISTYIEHDSGDGHNYSQ